MTLGEFIKAYIDKHDLSYEKFGEMCGLTKGYISMLIRNKNPQTGNPPIPKIRTYNNIAHGMNMTLDELLSSVDDEQVQNSQKCRKERIDSTMTPDYEKAACLAAETLITHRITTAPVMPLPILKTLPHVLVVSFAEMALQVELDRGNLLKSVGPECHDAMSFTTDIGGGMRYFVVYNQRLPFYLIQRGIARELGHIVLGHDGSRPEEVRTAEAQVFAYHLLCPRAIIRAVQESEVRLSTEVLGSMTGCFERCLAGMRKTPGVSIPANLNHMVREQFSDYLENFIDYQRFVSASDESALADFGTYMDGYEE